MTEYSEKLKDPRWQKKRLRVFERDNWTCRNCGEKEKTLHVHHLKYEKGKDPWDIEDKFLLTLCEECHEAEYQIRSDEERILLDVLREKGFMLKDLFTLHLAIEGSEMVITPTELAGLIEFILRYPEIQRNAVNTFLKEQADALKGM